MTDTYYKARLAYTPRGINVEMEEFKIIHETRCVAYCVNDYDYKIVCGYKKPDESLMQAAKRLCRKVRHIHKSGSRIAQPTQEEAFNRLKFLKRRQIRHLKRELDLISLFSSKTQDADLSALQKNDRYTHDTYLVPDTEESVGIYYNFGWDG